MTQILLVQVDPEKAEDKPCLLRIVGPLPVTQQQTRDGKRFRADGITRLEATRHVSLSNRVNDSAVHHQASFRRVPWQMRRNRFR